MTTITSPDRAYLLLGSREFGEYAAIPAFGGVALDENVGVSAAVREDNAELTERGEELGWAISGGLEFEGGTRIYEAPVNTWVNPRKLTQIYGCRGEDHFWGRVGSPVTREERQARAERDQYRKNHRDGVDPLKAVAGARARELPPRLSKPPRVYVATVWGMFRGRLGIFTTVQRAYTVAPAAAAVFEVPADGESPLCEGRLVRGRFRSGWGYASGYAPEDLNDSPRRQYEPHVSTS